MNLLLAVLFVAAALPATGALTCHDIGGSTNICQPTQSFCYRQENRAGCINVCGFPNAKCGTEEQKTCCCKEDNCNKLNGPSTTVIVFSALGAVLVIGIVIGLIVLCVLRQRKKTEKKAYTAIEAVEQVNEQEGIQQVLTTEQDVPQEDFMTTRIEPMLETDDKQELIDSLLNPQPIPGFDEFEKRPRIIKTRVYSTTDSITICEDLLDPLTDVPQDDTGFCGQILAEMISNGPQQFHFKLSHLKRVLEIGKEMFAVEPSLLRIKVPCTVYGDIHGQYSDLHRWLNFNGWPNKRRCLFLGDFVDRGSHGVEVVAMICCLKKIFPDGIYVCRGNHEEETLNKTYSFYDEVQHRFKDTTSGEENIYMHFKRVFTYLPLAALIGRRILGMHGGISPKLGSLKNIEDIRRPIDDFTVGSLACDLVWSDPNLTKEAGIGQLYSEKAVEEACERLDVDMIVRGHQAPLHGYADFAEGRLLTLFSAPGYKGVDDNTVNRGACMDCNETGELTIKMIKVSEEFRQKRIADVRHRDQVLKK